MKKYSFKDFSKIISINFKNKESNSSNLINLEKKSALKNLMDIKRRIILNDIKYTLYKWKYNSKIIKAEQEKNQIKKVLSVYIIYHKKYMIKKPYIELSMNGDVEQVDIVLNQYTSFIKIKKNSIIFTKIKICH